MNNRRLSFVLSLPVVLLMLVALSAARGEAEESRSARFFERAQAAVHAPQTPHFNSRDVQLTQLSRGTVPEAGRPITMPILPAGCGRGIFEGLDLERTMELAVDLFAIHGYELQPDLAAAGVRLDGLDPKAKVGFLIQPTVLGDARMPVRERAIRDLTALERSGYRVLILPASRYRCMQADTSSPMHAALLSIAEFLADMAGKRPADLSVLARGQPTHVEASGLEDGVAGATSFELSDAGAFFVLTQPATVTLEIVPPSKVQGRKRPTFVTLPFYSTPPLKGDGTGYDFDAPGPSFTLLQEGVPPLVSGRAVFLTDPTFDPSKPFRIRISLRPGQTHLGREVRVRTSTGKRR